MCLKETICLQSTSMSRIRQTKNAKRILYLLVSSGGHFGKVFLRFAIVMKRGDSGMG